GVPSPRPGGPRKSRRPRPGPRPSASVSASWQREAKNRRPQPRILAARGVCLPRPFPLPSWRSGIPFRSEEESALMAVKVVHVSDISGKEADEQSLGRLVVHEHPEYADLPVTLEVLPEEIESLQGASRFVTVEWIAPGARKGDRMVVSLDDFNLLAGAGVMESAVQDALIAKHRGRPRSGGGGAGGARGRSGLARAP